MIRRAGFFGAVPSGRRFLLGTFAFAVFGLSAMAAQADDIVVLVPGATLKDAPGGKVRGVVESESSKEVVVKLGASETKVPAEIVDTIQYGDTPKSILNAEVEEAAGRLAEAADLYKKGAAEASARPFVEQAARFKEVEVMADLAMSDPNKLPDAIKLMDAFQKAYPNGRHVGALLESQARLQLLKGDLAGVEKTIEAIAKLPNGEDRSTAVRAKILAKQGDHAKAIDELTKLIANAPEGSVRRRALTLSLAENLAAIKKYAEAETALIEVIRSNPAEDSAAQSAAYNTLGDCLVAAERYREALIAYLHTDLLYDKDKTEHPKALAKIAQLWRKLKSDDRADEAIQRLKTSYPRSRWVAEASTTSISNKP